MPSPVLVLASVMGPSGSGKSTLLNTLACRLTTGMWAEGEFRLNGRPYSQHDLKAMSGYVMQVGPYLQEEEDLPLLQWWPSFVVRQCSSWEGSWR